MQPVASLSTFNSAAPPSGRMGKNLSPTRPLPPTSTSSRPRLPLLPSVHSVLNPQRAERPRIPPRRDPPSTRLLHQLVCIREHMYIRVINLWPPRKTQTHIKQTGHAHGRARHPRQEVFEKKLQFHWGVTDDLWPSVQEVKDDVATKHSINSRLVYCAVFPRILIGCRTHPSTSSMDRKRSADQISGSDDPSSSWT